MFTTTNPFSRFSVDDFPEAKMVYQQTLKLEVTEEHKGIPLLTLHLGGGSKLLLYPKPDHTPATFTFLNFPVEDVDQAVAKSRFRVVVEHAIGRVKICRIVKARIRCWKAVVDCPIFT
ncbi:VOC family protein [Larkinella rosea]|uniref:VOC family protein n=1 Tax=Larkinella rosea TaxID=2025312 RepID=A0A3P1C2X9_9BACT|nr:VOC family protein [Larkinella rosea]RRB07638.1 VOC family protein [Larkinella rosea]